MIVKRFTTRLVQKDVSLTKMTRKINITLSSQVGFYQLKKSVEQEMKGIQLLDNELLVDHRKPTQELY